MNFDIIPSEYTVLVVDDIKTNILLLETLLKRAGYKTINALSGAEALEKMRDLKPDLVLLDVMMPGMSGYEVAAKAKADDLIKEIPIIFVTALSDPANIVEGFKIGGNDFISKPFNSEEIMIRIKHQLSLEASSRMIKAQKEELEQVIADRQQLYAVVAHDLRSPLGIIKTTLNMLSDSLDPQTMDPDMYELLAATNQSAEELYALLDNLLNWARFQMGKMGYNPEVFTFSEAVKSGIKSVDMMLNVNEMKVDLNVIEDSVVNADMKMISTVTRNLINNAIKYSETGSTINVEVKVADGMAQCSVIDHGAGIALDIQEMLRKNISLTTHSLRNEEGNGLGLTLCRDFMNKNKGQLWFESVPGEGSTFSFSVPVDNNINTTI